MKNIKNIGKLIYEFKHINLGEHVAGDWSYIKWSIYDDYTVIIYKAYEQDEEKNINFKTSIDSQVLSLINSKMKIAKENDSNIDTFDGSAWEIFQYENGNEIWHRKAGYIYGIKELEETAKILYNLIHNKEEFGDKKEFDDKLEQIRKVSIIELAAWWGLKYPGYSGTIITENKEIYSYQYYLDIPKELEDKNANFISKNKELSSDEYNKVKKFIEDEIIDKEFQHHISRDVRYTVSINYNGIKKTIVNNQGLEEGNLLIYDKAQLLIDELLNPKGKWIKSLLGRIKKIFSRNKIKKISESTEDSIKKNEGKIYEENLFHKYGNCNKLMHYGIKILFITDTHNCLAYTDKYITFLKSLKQSDYDICLILGDISGNDFEVIKSIIPNDKLYGIVGNHDSINALEVNNIKNINGQVIECKGVKIAAIMGSNRYKDGDYGMMTQEECLTLEQNMNSADILITHDRAYIYDRHDKVHDGFKGITDYIYRNHIPLHIHGHLHGEFEEILKNGTKSICLYQIKLLEI